MLHAEEQQEGALGLSPALMLTLRSRRVRVPSYGAEPNLELGLPELLLVEALSRAEAAPVDDVVADVAARTGTEEEPLRTFVDELTRRELVVPAAAPADGPHGLPAAPGDPLDRANGSSGPDAPPDGSGRYVLNLPLALRARDGAFEYVDHDGRTRLRVDAIELTAATSFCQPTTVDEAFEAHRRDVGELGLDRRAFAQVAAALDLAGLLRSVAPGEDVHQGRSDVQLDRQADYLRRQVEALRDGVRRYEERVGEARTKVLVVPVHPTQNQGLSVGMLVAFAQAWEGGRLLERYEFHPGWFTFAPSPHLLDVPGVFLFSNYVWSTVENLDISAKVKARQPRSVTVHGGPDTPKYPADAEAFFAANPHVDVTVRGEGELTTAELLAALVDVFDRAPADGPLDLSPLADVPGLSYREGDRVVHTADRERIADLDILPSPYLTGFFDIYGETKPVATIETNRGCPYGCTFCDWGSATLSRIRKFSLDRVFAELEWCAEHKVNHIFIADANFGILERDVQIAEKVAQLKHEVGYPKVFSTNYAKNTIKHLRTIVEVMADAGILTEGLLSLQSMDDTTLSTVRRSNIKVEKYDELAREFRRARLPLFVDIMLGLPGSTPQSFRADLQRCIDREVQAKVYLTELLVNSPMNEPSYREEHSLTTMPVDSTFFSATRAVEGTSRRALVVSSSSFTQADYVEMLDFRRIFRLLENFAVLRYVSRFARQAAGLEETALYERMRTATDADPHRWPALTMTLRAVPNVMLPPVSWKLLIDEVRTLLVEVLGVPDDSALDTVLAVQHALLPARNRTFPTQLELPHDFAAWYAAVLEAKDGGHRDDWPSVVPELRTFGPATFVVDDPNDICTVAVGYRNENDYYGDWELRSPVARSVAGPKFLAEVS